MLRELYLRGLGVIAEASIELAPGLNVVTGETGVGKTLLITSLGLLCGGRGHTRLVSEGAKEAVVQAIVSPPDAMRCGLAARGIEPEDADVILVRRLSSDGRSRASIDGQLVPVSALAEIGETLVEVHGQGAGFALARGAAQLAAIDALARNDEPLARYRDALSVMRALARERTELADAESTRAREIDLLAYQVDEIDRASLEPDEDERLPAAIARLEHGEKLGAIGADVVEQAGAEGAAGALAEAHRALEGAAAFDPDVAPLVSRLGALAVEASELSRDVRAWSESMEADPAQLESLRERKALLGSLKRKYGPSVADVLAYAETSRAQLAKLVGADDRIAAIDAELEEATKAVEALAGNLTKRRKRACKELTKLVGAELPALALPNAVFTADLEATDPTETGADRVRFLFSSSASRTATDIGKVASGGELSRAMIAVTLALAQAHAVPVLVFDEADAGVGGEAALELGRRLQRLGRSHQVLVVSHLPQIAAFADRHIVVERNGDDVAIRTLEDDARLGEVSRMLAGLGASERARAHASELLELAAG